MFPIRTLSPKIRNYLFQQLKAPVGINYGSKFYSHKNTKLKVTLCGAAGNIGQPLSLMLKQSPLIDELALYDIEGTTGLASELGHIDTKCKVTSYTDRLCDEAFKDANVVVVAVASSKSGLKDVTETFEANACVVREIMEYCAAFCPNAIYALSTTPIDSLVPLATEVLKKKGVYNPKTLLGVTSIDVVRANTFVADLFGIEPECVTVPVIGGHHEDTIVPLLSLAKPCADFTPEEIEKITMAVKTAHTDIIKIKGNEAATLSSAFAIARFVISLLKGLKGQGDIVECAFIRTDAHPKTKYMALPVQLGPGGIMKDFGLPTLSDYETCLLDRAIPQLVTQAARGKAFLGIKEPVPCDPCDPSPKAPLCPEDWCEKKAKQTLHDT